MAINIKNLEARIQKKAASVTSNTPTAELGDIIEAANLATGGLAQYDSAGLLPTASSTQNIKIAYLKKDNSIRFNSGSAWNTMAPGAAAGGANPTVTPYSNRLGTTSGYAVGGRNPGAPAAPTTIDKYSLASDANATDVGDNPSPIYGGAGVYSDTHGYVAGDHSDTSIWKYSFASDGNSSDTTYDITKTAPQSAYGAGITSETHGYTAGGAASHPNSVDVIDRFPFSTEANSTDVGDLLTAANYVAGNNSSDNGYTHGGQEVPSSPSNVIQKFPFASATTNTTDVGDLLTSALFRDHNSSSVDHGYAFLRSPATNVIEKYAFATDGNSSDVGDMTANLRWGAAATSPTHGYAAGGGSPYSNVIAKFTTSSDANATDVGDLTVNRDFAAGGQY